MSEVEIVDEHVHVSGDEPCSGCGWNMPDRPVILHQGHYRLYEKPDGTLRIQYKRDDKDEEDFMELPGAMVQLAKSAAEGNLNPAQMMRQVAKLMMGNRSG